MDFRARRGLGAGLCLALLLGLAACGPAAPGPPRPLSEADIAPYREFLTPGPLVPLRATGSISVSLAGETETGDFILAANPAGEFSIQVLAKVTGSLMAELRLNQERLLLLNFAEKTFFQAGNQPDNRRRLLGLDLSPAEFLMALTGRVPEADYKAARGVMQPGGYAEMKRGAVRYLFALDRHGLPRNWVKEEGAKVVMRVEYRAYLLLYGPEGDPVRVPHKIRIFARDEKPVMVLGVADFRPGAKGLDALVFSPPQDKGWHFRPPPEGAARLFRNL